nr:integrase, catalytic region, zinc finger, CCHC-type, peptidase aspartic, catalytic [Tanacetum cinerariifolium]
MLLDGSELTKEDRESQLYDEFEHSRQHKEESIHDYYVRFAKLINDMRNIKMTMSKLQLNSKFVNNILPEWGRFVTAVKLNRGLRDSNYDQLFAYLKQHEAHAKENKMILECLSQPTAQPTSDPLALLSNVSNTHHGSPSSVVVQNVQGRPNRGQGMNPRGGSAAGYGEAQNRVGNVNQGQVRLGQARTVKCYNCNGTGHIAQNCTQPKRPQNSEYFKDKMLLMQAEENGVALDAEQLLFLAGTVWETLAESTEGAPQFGPERPQVYSDLTPKEEDRCMNLRGGSAAGYGGAQNRVGNVNLGQARPSQVRPVKCYNCNGGQDNAFDDDVDEQPVQDLALNVDNVFQADDCDTFNSDVDEALTAQTMFMANLSSADPFTDEAGPSYDSDILSKVHDHDHYQDATCAHHEEHVMHDSGIQRALTKEIKEIKDVFEELEAKVAQYVVDRKHDATERKKLLIANDNLIAECLSKEVFSVVTNSELNVARFTEMTVAHTVVEARCLELEAELAKLLFVIGKMQAFLQGKDNVIRQLKKQISQLNNRDSHLDYLRHLKESVETTSDIVEEAKVVRPFDRSIVSAYRYPKHSQELLEYVIGTCPQGSQKRDKQLAHIPLNRKKQVTIAKQSDKSDSCSKHIMGDRSRLMNFVKKFIGTVRFGNDNFGAIMGYGDYVIGNSVISRVYYVEGLGHNLFFVGQFCDSDLEVAFRKHSCYVRETDGVELIKGSRGSNLYTISVEDMMKSSPICLLSKASKNKTWLWHRRLNHLNFSTINDLARKDFVRGLPRLKFKKDHLCSACQLGKSKKHTHKPKIENTNLVVLNTLHMDLCGPMRVQIINGKKYILVIVDDYSRFT